MSIRQYFVIIVIFGMQIYSHTYAIELDYDKGEHPRIFINASDISQIATRCSEDSLIHNLYVEMKSEIDSHAGDSTTLSRYCIGSALTYIIETEIGDTIEAVKFLEYAKICNTSGLVYDWIYNGLTTEERISFGDTLFSKMVWYEEYMDGHYYLRDWHHAWVDGGSAVMYLDFLYRIIAIYNEDINNSEVQRYLDEYEIWFRNVLLPFINLEGAVDPEGGYNSPQYIAFQVEAWDKALDENNWTGNKFLEEKCFANIMFKKPFNNYCPFVAVDCFLSRITFPNTYLRGAAPLYEKNNSKGYGQYIANYVIENFRNEWDFEIYTPWRILWYDPSRPAIALNSLPKAKFFDGNPSGLSYGIAVFRTGFDEDGTLIIFKCGDSYSPYKSFNGLLNHFAIYHRGDLAKIDGSDGHYYGGGYLKTFQRQTIAGNAITVSDPDNPVGIGLSPWSPHYNDPYYIFTYDQSICNAPGYEGFGGGAPYFGGSAVGDHFEGAESDVGDIIYFESKEGYSYVVGDASDAFYDSVCTLYQRELAFLREKYLIVFDRVTSAQPHFVKRWYLHTIGEPVMSGNMVSDNSTTEGATEWDGNLAYADCNYAGGTMGRLYVKKLLPFGNFRKRGGEGFEYWCDGLNYPPDTTLEPMPEEHEGRPGWRLEEDAQTQENDIFLNVLYPTDAEGSIFPEVTLIDSGNVKGTFIKDTEKNITALFSSNSDGSEITDDTIAYAVTPNTDTVMNFIFNLPANEDYDYFVEVGSDKWIISVVRNGSMLTSSENGVLTFIVVSEAIKERRERVYPNPCRVYLEQRFITFDNLNLGNIINIYDISGKLVHNSGEITTGSYSWNVGNLSSGTYFYKMEGSDKASGKIVIIR